MSFRVEKQPEAVLDRVRRWRKRGRSVAFVPTMGALHAGHLSLVRLAQRKADKVVASIFVNPKQFGAGEDLESYPRDLPSDLKKLSREGVDLGFTPTARRMYPPGDATTIHMPSMETVLEGKSRPDHFSGVLLVVLKLLHIVEPDFLILGQKDAQQAVILSRMVLDLNLPVRVIRGRIIREADGLAMSSRNVYLSKADRSAAPALHRGLLAARKEALSGRTSVSRVASAARRILDAEPRIKTEYLAVVDALTLQPLHRLTPGRILIAGAAHLGGTRLIDNEEFRIKK